MQTPVYVLIKALRENKFDRLADEQELVLLKRVREIIDMLDGDHISVTEFVDIIAVLRSGEPVEDL